MPNNERGRDEDMSNYRFDDRVAVVTGAGRGIGRGYALLLGTLGAKVVVNDLGSTKEGAGSDLRPAEGVVAEIQAAGGVAIADGNDISSVAGSQALIDTAVTEFGRVDVVINNAGNVRWADLPEIDVDVIEAHLAVHTKGSFNTTRAAWPHMLEQDYGRVVMTGSTGMFGLPGNIGYATAKASFIGMAKSMTISARKRNIKINVIAPNAATRMGGQDDDGTQTGPPQMEPELVAPMAAYLAHEACTVSGEIYVAGAGRFSRIFVAATEGYVHPGTDAPTIDDVAANWDAINDEAGYYVPRNLMDWAGHYLSHRS
jgi:NAD(P)-dependent dehydrogenase (short-subunit alcohol dehydrogenase family)